MKIFYGVLLRRRPLRLERISSRIISIFILSLSVGSGSSFADWTAETVPAGAGSLHAISFVNTYTGWAVGSGGIIIKTTNGGIQWKKQQSGVTTDLNGVKFINVNKGWAVGNAGKIIVTSDGGTTWNPQTSGTGINLKGVSFVDESLGFACNNDEGSIGVTVPEIFKTTNGGTTWQAIANVPGGYMAQNVKMLSKDVAFVVTFLNGIWKTIDGGATWSPKQGANSTNLQDIDFANASVGLAAGFYFADRLFRTTDAGETWIPVALPAATTSSFTGISFADEQHAWVVAGGGSIFSTADAGATWIKETGASGVGNRGVSFVNRGRGWACGSGVQEYSNPDFMITAPASVRFSTDTITFDTTVTVKNTGEDSLHISLTLDDSVFSITSAKKFALAKGASQPVTIRFAPKAYGIKNAELIIESEAPVAFVSLEGTLDSAVSAIVDGKEISIDTLFQNYPNPFGESTTIMMKGGRLFEVRDMLGRVVYETLLQNDETKIIFDAPRLPNGLYSYSLIDEVKIRSRIMIVAK